MKKERKKNLIQISRYNNISSSLKEIIFLLIYSKYFRFKMNVHIKYSNLNYIDIIFSSVHDKMIYIRKLKQKINKECDNFYLYV